MSINLVRAPLVIGAVIAGPLLFLALAALITSNSRWDDHLINAMGVLLAALVVSVTLRLTINAFRPRPGAGTGTKVINILLFVALVLFVGVAAMVAWFLSDMSFL